MLTGGADPGEATGVPPEGFVRLAPAEPQTPGNHRVGLRPGAGVVLSFLIAVGAGLASLQTLIPWAPWRAVMQAAGVLVMFGGLGIWARLTRSRMVAGQPCACERPVAVNGHRHHINAPESVHSERSTGAHSSAG